MDARDPIFDRGGVRRVFGSVRVRIALFGRGGGQAVQCGFRLGLILDPHMRRLGHFGVEGQSGLGGRVTHADRLWLAATAAWKRQKPAIAVTRAAEGQFGGIC